MESEPKIPAEVTATTASSITEQQGGLDDHEAYAHNMHVVENAINTIGMGRYQWQLFFTCGFGYFTDQMLLTATSLALPQVVKEFYVGSSSYAVIALYGGLLSGSIVSGILTDVVGRRIVWVTSLFMVAIFCMITGGAPTFPAMCVFVALTCFGGGGNLTIDLTVFVEFLPASHGYLLTAMGLWWGVGNMIGGFIAWPLIGFYSCPGDATPETCSMYENMGWRYQYITVGAICLVLGTIRVFLFKIHESPKWLVSQGQFDKGIDCIMDMAHTNNRPHFVLETSQFAVSRVIRNKSAQNSRQDLLVHLKGVFATKQLGFSTFLVMLTWMCVQIAYPLFSVYLPTYLARENLSTGDDSNNATYRDYSIIAFVGIFGPVVAAGFVWTKFIGRRRNLFIFSASACVLLGGLTAVNTTFQYSAVSGMLTFVQNGYFASLYAYTAEVMPTAHRGTGSSMAIACGRVAALMSPIIGMYADTSTIVPIWICLSMYCVIALSSLFLPYESREDVEK